MGRNLIASRIHDPAIVRRFLSRIGQVIAEDGVDIERAEIDTGRNCWLAIYESGQEVAMYKLIPVNSVSLEIHANVLPEFRHMRHDTCKTVYRWILDFSKYQKLIAWVPALHKHIKRFAVEMGMTVEGVSTDSYRKNGKLHNQWLLGITRQQMEALV